MTTPKTQRELYLEAAAKARRMAEIHQLNCRREAAKRSIERAKRYEQLACQ